MGIEFRLNGEQQLMEQALTVEELVRREVGDQAEHVAVAVNGDVIERSRWEECSIADGDEVELIKPIQGGEEESPVDRSLTIADRELTSRLLMGTGGFTNLADLENSLEAGQPDMVTVGLRRVDVEFDESGSLMDVVTGADVEILPNTAGCYTAEDAVQTARMGREALDTNWVKLEVIGDDDTLYPDAPELLEATRTLVRDDFVVLPYTTPDPIVAKKLESIGCPAVMPLGAPIGSGRGLADPDGLRLVVDAVDVPVIVDAGIGCATDAAEAIELGAEAVLSSSAIARAEQPELMAEALRYAVRAGLFSRSAGRIPEKLYAKASTPMEGRIRS